MLFNFAATIFCFLSSLVVIYPAQSEYNTNKSDCFLIYIYTMSLLEKTVLTWVNEQLNIWLTIYICNHNNGLYKLCNCMCVLLYAPGLWFSSDPLLHCSLLAPLAPTYENLVSNVFWSLKKKKPPHLHQHHYFG